MVKDKYLEQKYSQFLAVPIISLCRGEERGGCGAMRWCRVGLRPGWRLLESSQSPGHHSSVRPCDPDRLTDRQTDRLTD